MPSINMSAEGRVIARRLDRNGNEIQRLEFHNDFLQVGLDYLTDYALGGFGGGTANSNAFINQFGYLFLGTGTTDPTPQDTGLENRSGTLAGKADPNNGSHASDYPKDAGVDDSNNVYWTEVTLSFVYGEGEAEGVWTELGLAADSSYTNPMTRALFRDENGDPTSLTILSDEFLDVTYTVRFYSGVSDPVPGSVTVGGETTNFKLYPWKGGSSNGWLSNSTATGYEDEKTSNGLWAFYFPFCCVQASTSLYSIGYSPRVTSSDDLYGSASYGTYDAPSKTITHTFVYGPTTNDVLIEGFVSSSRDAGYASKARERGLYAIVFDTPFTKKADYEVIITIQATINWQGNQMTGVQMTAATASRLDFSWDAFPDATSYELVLRQAGTIVDTQTITAPTTTASFTGLSASTSYDLDIRAITSNLNGSRSIHSASTTA